MDDLKAEIEAYRKVQMDRRSGLDRRQIPRPDSIDRRSMYERTRELIASNTTYDVTITNDQLKALADIHHQNDPQND